MAVKQNLRRRVKGLTDEEKANKIKDIAKAEELAWWRAECLRSYREKTGIGLTKSDTDKTES